MAALALLALHAVKLKIKFSHESTHYSSFSYLDFDFFFLLGVEDGDLEESLSESGRILQ